MTQQPFITSISINWHHNYHNLPSFEFTINEKPDISAYRYQFSNGIYFAQMGDMASFFFYEAPGQGYGGSMFKITMQDGEEETLIGPWSSSCSAVADEGFPLTVDGAYVWEGEYPHGQMRLAGHVLQSAVIGKIGTLCPGINAVRIGHRLVPHPENGCITDHKQMKPHQTPFRCPICDVGLKFERALNPAWSKDMSDDQLGIVTL